jgi:hypothetical protein
MDGFDDIIRVGRSAVQHALGHLKASARSVRVEIVVANAGTVLSKPLALDLIKGNPSATKTHAAAFHHWSVIL